MKKRGQTPNAQTFTIIFTGLARSEHPTVAVAEAVKLFQSMLTSDRIRPNDIHLNAVINVCARAQDIDSLFSVLQSADERGLSPNRVTYSIVLHALRASVISAASDTRIQYMTEEQLQENKNLVLQRCKSIWDEIIRRWRAGSLQLDEELVCAMGRVLLLGNSGDVEAVLDLMEQTMKIPKMIPSNYKNQKKHANPTTSAVASAGSGIYVKPGNNAISLIMQTLTMLRWTRVAMEYWSLLTTTYRVNADSNNWHWLMATVKRGHASGQAADIVTIMPRKFLNFTTFRMAIAACMKDSNNRNVYRHADTIANLMLQTLPKPDPEATREYLTLVASRLHYALRLRTAITDEAAFKESRLHVDAVVASLSTVHGHIHKVLESREYRDVDHNALKTISGSVYNETAEYISISRKLASLCDQLNGGIPLPANILQQIRQRRENLNRHIKAFYVATDAPNDQLLDTNNTGHARAPHGNEDNNDGEWASEPGSTSNPRQNAELI
jgi:pentatricopeptide repeat protein